MEESKDKLEQKFFFRTKGNIFKKLKIRNIIFFGFFVVAFVSGFLNYISNSLIVGEFADFNRMLQLSNSVMADQEKLELIVENYVSIRDYGELPEIDFTKYEAVILSNLKAIGYKIEIPAQKSAILMMTGKNKELLSTEKEAISIHKNGEKLDSELTEAFAEEENFKKTIKNYVLNNEDKELQEKFSLFENKRDEAIFEFKERIHIHAGEWLNAFDDFKLYAESSRFEMPDIKNYEILGLRISELSEEIEKSEIDEKDKISETRNIKNELYHIHGDVAEILMTEKINSVNDLIYVVLIGFLILIIILIVIVGHITSYFVTNPMKKLVNFALDVSKGDFRKRIEADSNDEIGRMAEAFNLMLDKAEESKIILEIKVNARTKRLKELSSDLENQIKLKTKELNDKIFQLERFNDLSVGREIRMVELKRELEILKQGKKMEGKRKNGEFASRGADKKNCWDFWNCSKEIRDKCPAYLSGHGRECWIVSAGKCPRSKEKGIENCRDCSWHKELHKAL